VSMSTVVCVDQYKTKLSCTC